MEKERKKQIIKDALETYGVEAQKTMMIEECSELMLALAREKRGRKADVITELADVYIMYRQLKLLYGVAAVNEEIERKLVRLEGRIAEHKAKHPKNDAAE